jgi:excisionase family DNA binding protein
MEFPQEVLKPLLYSIDEAACIVSLSPSTIRRAIKNGYLNAIYPTVGTVRITRAELERFIREARDTSAKTAPDCTSLGGH